MKPNTDHGKAFERKLHDAFRQLYLKHPCTWERVIDSHEAGNIVRKADADFKLIVKSGLPGRPFAFNIEAKASVVVDTWQGSCEFRSFIKPNQVAKMRIAERAGVCGVYLFQAVRLDHIEVWPARPINDIHSTKRKPLGTNPAMTIAMANLDHWAHLIVTKPADFHAQLEKHA